MSQSRREATRYWIRDITPPEEIGRHIWLEVFPKYQHDAVNFEKATVMLNDKDYTIYGLQIFHPGEQQRTTFYFSKVTKDFRDWVGTEFAAPKTPRNWTKEVDPVDEARLPRPRRPRPTPRRRSKLSGRRRRLAEPRNANRPVRKTPWWRISTPPGAKLCCGSDFQRAHAANYAGKRTLI